MGGTSWHINLVDTIMLRCGERGDEEYQAPDLVYGSGIAPSLGYQFRTYDNDMQVTV